MAEYVMRECGLKSEEDLQILNQEEHSGQWNVLSEVVAEYWRRVEISLD